MYVALQELRQYPIAIECYDKTLEHNLMYTYAWNNKGRIYDELLSYEKALECNKKALELDPKYARAWNGVGRYLKLL